MSGTVIRIGRYRSSSGPDLALVYDNQQLASFTSPASHSSRIILYRAGAWIGRYSGNPRARVGLLWHASDGASPNNLRPGGRAAYSGEMVPSTGYTGGGGGQQMFANLIEPFVTDANYQYTIAITNSSGVLGTAMFQASAISEPNESFYRKGISGNVPVDGVGSTRTNEGQLVGWFEGEANVAPTAPTSMSPSGNISSRTPVIAGNFNDANKTLNNGVAWDRPEATQIQVRRVSGGVMMWDHTYTTSSSERSNQRTSRTYAGSALLYETTYQFRIRHRDRAGAWGAWSGWQSFVIKYNNRKPNNPSSFSGLGTHHGTRSLVVGSNFTDPDLPTLPDGQAYDRFEYKQVRVRRRADNVLVYNPGAVATTTSEKNNRRSYTTYTLPAYNVPYLWEERHRDRFGAWSNWVAIAVVAYSGGSAERPSSPSGRVTNMSNPGNIVAVYRNSGGLSANRVRVALYTSTGGLIKSVEVAVSVAPNGTISIPWSVLGTTLAPATSYGVGVRPRDSSGTWATDMSPLATITTNAPPTTPTLYGPQSGQSRSTVPATTVRVRDPDQPNSQLTTTAELYDGDTDTLLSTYDLPWLSSHAQDNIWSASPSLPGYGYYKWRARANDGYLNGPWSQMWSFRYAAVPIVTITEPDGPTITTSQPTFTWTCPNQTHWRLRGYDGGTVVFDTGEVAGGTQSYILPSATNWVGTERWNNLESFDWVVSVRDSSTLWGDSAALSLTLEYIPPDPLIVEVAEARAFSGVDGTHYAFIQLSQTTYAEGEFREYIGDRVEIDGPAGNEIPGTLITRHFVEGNSAVTMFEDYDVTANQWYRWAFRQSIESGVDIIESPPVYAEAMVSFHGTLLHMPFDPLNNYVWLKYGEIDGRYEPSREHGMAITSETDLNGDVHNYIGGKPTVSPSGAYTFLTGRTSESPTAMQQLDTLYRMFVYQNPKFNPDGRPHGLCWREGRGGRSGRQYVMLANWRDTTTMGGTQAVDLEFIPNVNGGDQ